MLRNDEPPGGSHVKDNSMVLADLALARRLERAEGDAAAQFAMARRRLFPDCGSDWRECAGAYLVYDGPDSPVTQTFGLGVFETPLATAMEEIERYFRDKGASVFHEVTPLAGLVTANLLCERGYRPVEISSALYQPVSEPGGAPADGDRATVRVANVEEADLWADVSARGWAQEAPALFEFLRGFGQVAFARERSACFLAEWDGVPAAAGALCWHDGVALFAGSATVPEFRRRGLQAGLLRARMRHAREMGCDLAMMVAEAGSQSQRNAERQGFRIAYTRTKWKLL